MSWLKKYYGSDFEKMNPEVVDEGKKFAIVKLTRQVGRDFSGVGFVLIKKTDSHNASKSISLHEGLPSAADMKRMKDELKKAEGK